jgi:UDP-2,3-diacylglucosamine hydrolase
MRICVVSDCHVKYVSPLPEDEQNYQALLSFLAGITGKYDLLVLNGDIFDLWFDWRYTIIKQYFPVLHRLAEIGEHGCRIVHVSGNHDFWFNDFLTEYLNIGLYKDFFSLEADGRRMLFTHGDLHTVNDLRYKLFRRFIRLRGMKWLFAAIHPDLALSLGRKISRSSRLRRISLLLQSKKNAGLEAYAARQIEKGSYDLVAMGHSHDPAVKRIGQGWYANSGDWLRHYSYLEIIDGNIELKYHDIKE